MDEILTTWSTSLATHQKSFATLSQKIATWDRALTENSTAITKLYSRCFQAERDCAEVERQLTNVEGAQGELENRLSQYEEEVERMLSDANISSENGGAGGVDGERERVYRLAETSSSRLSDMSHSLTDMIEEINSASQKLGSASNASGKSKGQGGSEDPLNQIIRTLNGHLAQLQVIDGGAASLQAKVSAAQREARALGARQGISAGEWVDDFRRSYLGRR